MKFIWKAHGWKVAVAVVAALLLIVLGGLYFVELIKHIITNWTFGGL